jgi:hypothetical protein
MYVYILLFLIKKVLFISEFAYNKRRLNAGQDGNTENTLCYVSISVQRMIGKIIHAFIWYYQKEKNRCIKFSKMIASHHHQ